MASTHLDARRLDLRALVGLGATLARRGPMAVISMLVSGLTAVAFVVLGVVLARRGRDAPVEAVPILASSALAWGGGFLHAFSASANALRRDYTTGIRHLFITRTTSMRGYLVARVGGLAALVGAFVGGGTLLAGLAALLASGAGAHPGRTLQATLASLVFAAAYAMVVAPLALATLGARSRARGYVILVLVLVLPTVVAEAAPAALPSEIAELCSVPSALGALRASLGPGTVDLLRGLRALVALLVFGGLALFFVRRDVILLEVERELA